MPSVPVAAGHAPLALIGVQGGVDHEFLGGHGQRGGGLRADPPSAAADTVGMGDLDTDGKRILESAIWNRSTFACRTSRPIAPWRRPPSSSSVEKVTFRRRDRVPRFRAPSGVPSWVTCERRRNFRRRESGQCRVSRCAAASAPEGTLGCLRSAGPARAIAETARQSASRRRRPRPGSGARGETHARHRSARCARAYRLPDSSGIGSRRGCRDG